LALKRRNTNTDLSVSIFTVVLLSMDIIIHLSIPREVKMNQIAANSPGMKLKRTNGAASMMKLTSIKPSKI